MTNLVTNRKRFPMAMVSVPHVFLWLCIVVAFVSSWMLVDGGFDQVAILGMIALTVLFAYLWLLFRLGDRHIRYTLLIPGVSLILSVTLIPIVFLLYLSVHNVTLLNFNKSWDFVGLQNYTYFFTSDDLFFPALTRTVEYMILVLGFQLVIGMALALLLQKEFRGRSLISTVLVIPVMASPIVIAMLWKYMFSSFNGFINLVLKMLHLPEVAWLTNTPLPIISDLPVIGTFLIEHLNANLGFLSAVIVNVWQWTPFVFLMFLAGLSALPKEPYEAAKVDGANGWQTFWNITYPMMKPVISVVVLIRIIDLMKVYDQIWVLFGDSIIMRTLNIHIFSTGLTNQDYSKGAALSVIVLAIVVLSYMLFSFLSDWFSRRGGEQ